MKLVHQENPKQIRRKPTHGVIHLSNQPTLIFDTVCTKNRQPWLANDDVYMLLKEVWSEADAWLMGRFVIMPDHIHFFAAATESHITYDNWVKYWKSQFSKKHKNPNHRWLSGHWDRRMRTEQQYEEKWNYVQSNPVRHHLVSCPEDWVYQGEIHELCWS